MIPLFATRPVIEPLLGEVAERQRTVLESGRYILGPEVEAFEREFAAYVGRAHCVGVANGTEALTIALRALGIKPGDEVVVPDFTFFATAEAVINAGARPVFAEIDPGSHCVTAATVEPAISPDTRAILAVHIFGNPAPMGEIMELARSRDLVVLEDAAQAAGARLDGKAAGSLGHAAAFSFYPGKNLGAFGDAGAIVTDDDEIARQARLLRVHGSTERWVHERSGYNSRLDELQASALRVLLPHLDDWTVRRREAAQAYLDAGIEELATPMLPTPDSEPAHHLYVVMAPERERLTAALADDGIEARAYYTLPMHRQPALEGSTQPGEFPNAERLAADGLALPMGPALKRDHVERVVGALRRNLGSGVADAGTRPA